MEATRDRVPEHLKGPENVLLKGKDDNWVKNRSSIMSDMRTNLEYIARDLRKRNRQFQIGLITIFIIVTFSTLVVAFLNCSSSIFFMIGQANAGDFDLTLTALPLSQQYEKGNDNFFNDV